jgi:hypothetical protein
MISFEITLAISTVKSTKLRGGGGGGVKMAYPQIPKAFII